MKKTILCLLTAACSVTMLQAQTVPVAYEAWKTTQGTQNFYYKSVTKTDVNGNVVVAGATMNGPTTDILVAKYNSKGNMLWIKQFAGAAAGGVDFAAGLYVTDTHVYLTGAITNNSITPQTDCVTMKLATTNGSVVWSSTYVGAGGGHDAGRDITVDASGNVYVSGSAFGSGSANDYLAIKYNSAGAQQWATTWDYAGADDGAIKVALNGTFLNITGAGATTTPGNYKMSTLKLTQATGSVTAVTTSTAVTTTSVEVVCDMVLDGSGNIYLAGSYDVSGQGTNFYVQKLSASTLASAWVYTFNGAAGSTDVAKAIGVDASGNVYIAGYSTSTGLAKELTLIRLNSAGTPQWTQTSGFTGDDEAADLAVDASGNAYVTGYKTSAGNRNYYTCKYTAAGVKKWEMELNGVGYNDNATNIALDSLNNVIVTGQSGISPTAYEFVTAKYVQHDMVPYTDVNNEPIDKNLVYLPNKGQLVNTNLSHETGILYYNLTNYPETYLAKNRMSFLQFHTDTLAATTDSLERIDLVFNKANANVEIFHEDKGTDHDYNFFVGNVTATGLHGYNKLIYPNLYAGIDLHYSSNAYGIKACFVLKPGADPRDIELVLQGMQSSTLTANNLVVSGLLGNIVLRKPNIYNINGGVNVPVSGTGWAISSNTVSFNTGSYNSAQPLVIEFSLTSAAVGFNQSAAGPSDNIDWCTYYGNTSADGFARMAVDKYNNKYFGGTSNGNNYPTTAGVFQGNNPGGTAVVISKFNMNNERRKSTYYRGTSTSSTSNGVRNVLGGIAVDSLQRVFFTGTTNTNNFPFPATQPGGSYNYTVNPTNSTNSTTWFYSAYVIKLDSAMALNLWGSFIGDTYNSYGNDIMVDNTGNVTVVGETGSLYNTFNFPSAPAGAYYSSTGRGFLMRFNNNGAAQYGTKIGANVMRVEKNQANGDYFIGCKILGSDVGQYYKNPGGVAYYDNSPYGDDFYVARFNSQDDITWATVFGGVHADYFYDMALRDSTLILLGQSNGGNGFPIKYAPGQYVDSVHTNTGQTDMDIAFVRFNSYTGKHVYSSYFGGSYLHDYASSCVIDKDGSYYIGGNTYSTIGNFDLQQSGSFYYNGNYYSNNGYILSYDKNNNKRITTYLGGRQYFPTSGSLGASNTYVYDMGVTASGDLILAGQTEASRYFPIYDGSNGTTYYMDTVLNYPTGSAVAYSDAFIALLKQPTLSGIKDQSRTQVPGNLMIYPNPGQDVFFVEMDKLSSDKNVTFKVYNAVGQMVYHDEAKVQDGVLKKQINLSQLSPGMYIISVSQDNKQESVKVIKQ